MYCAQMPQPPDHVGAALRETTRTSRPTCGTRPNRTGKEMREAVDFMTPVQDAPAAEPSTEPSPKRFNF